MISIFPLWTFHLYGVYISQLIRYSWTCGSYQVFLDRRLLPSSKLLNQGFLLVKLKSKVTTDNYVPSTLYTFPSPFVRRVWRYQRGNQNPYIEEEHTTQWPKEKGQKDKQRTTKHTHKTKDRVTRTAWNQDNVSEWGDMFIRELLFQWALYKSN
jgi:hypothetical protein